MSGALQIDFSNHSSTGLLISLEVDSFQEAGQWHLGTIGLLLLGMPVEEAMSR
jgi:hypothetical protein